MQKRMKPFDYFTALSPGAPGRVKPQQDMSNSEIYKAINQIKQQAPEPKIVYVDKPYPVEVPKPIEMGNPNGNNEKIPWGLITVLGIVGIVSVAIVAIALGGKK